MRLRYIMAATAMLAFSVASHASTITFSGASTGPFTGPVTEAGFTYKTYSGGLYSEPLGNPGQDMEGSISAGGGVLSISSASSGLFSFSSVDFAAANQAETLTVMGYLNGILVGTDTYTLPSQVFTGGPFSFTNEQAMTLAGVNLSELRITLPAQSNSESDAVIDNVSLSSVNAAATPEPSSFALLGTGVLGVIGAARRRFAA